MVTCWPGLGETMSLYVYIIYTSSLGLGIAVSVRKREQGRFRESIEGVGGSSEGAGESRGE
jgi:hypothetical protein